MKKILLVVVLAVLMGVGVIAFFILHGRRAGVDRGVEGMATSEPVAAIPQEERMATYRGMVVDEQGKGVNGVKYVVYRGHWLWPEWKVEGAGMTGADGGFEYGPVEREDSPVLFRRVRFDAAGYGWTWSNPQKEYMKVSGEAVVWKVTLKRGTVIAGQVVDEKGVAVKGALVEADGAEESMFSEQVGQAVRTDEQGRFRFERVAQGERFGVYVTHPDFARFESLAEKTHAMWTVPAGTTDFAAVLKQGAVVHGRLVMDGKPVKKAGVRMVAKEEGALWGTVVWGVSDAEGRLEFRGLSEGKWDLVPRVIDGGGDGPVVEIVRGVELKSGEEKDVEIGCEAGEVLRGVAKDPETGRVSREAVFVYPPGEKIWPVADLAVDEQGRFSARLPVGTYRLRSRGWENFDSKNFFADVEVKAGMEEAAMNVGMRKAVRGQLVNDEGKGVAGIVAINSVARATDGEGRFVIWPEYFYEEKTYGVAVDAERKIGCGFLLSGVEAREEQKFVMEPMGAIVGQVVDKNKKGFGSAKVSAIIVGGKDVNYAVGDDWLWKTTMGKDGRFRIAPVPIGYHLEVMAEGGNDDDATTEVNGLDAGEEWEVRPLVLGSTDGDKPPADVLTGNVEIAGVLVDEKGEIVAGQQLQTQAGTREIVASDDTDFKGRFVLKGLAAGKEIEVSAYIYSAAANKQQSYLWKVKAGEEKARLVMDEAHLQK